MTPPPLCDVLVIGAMKCGTTTLHRWLAAHPQVAAAPEKEVNFFFGDRPGGPGNLWRGIDWYHQRFGAGDVRAEASPGYTSPDHPGVADRIAHMAPEAKLVYLVRDPLARAVSQYRHHRRDGAEPRDLATALTDPEGHYVRRSRFGERLAPFLERVDSAQIAVVTHDEIADRGSAVAAALYAWIGVDPTVRPDGLERRWNAGSGAPPTVPPDVAARFAEAVADDVAAFAPVRRRLSLLSRAGA